MSTYSRREYFLNLRRNRQAGRHFQCKNFENSENSETRILIETEVDGIDPVLELKNNIGIDLDRIDELLAKLEDKLEQFKFGLPTILLNSEKSIYESTKQEIDQSCFEVKSKLESSINVNFNERERNKSQLIQNIRSHAANRLSQDYEKFQVFQKMFNSILYRKQEKATAIDALKCESQSQSYSYAHSQQSQSHDQQSQSYSLAVLDEGQAVMLEERSEEISQVIEDALNLQSILQQIQLMTVQQGSLLDRIDVNLDGTRTDLSKAIVQLEKTAESFSVHQKRLVLSFITLAILVTTGLILNK